MKWEMFYDESYYDCWAVRPEEDKDFNSPRLFHFIDEEDAKSFKWYVERSYHAEPSPSTIQQEGEVKGEEYWKAKFDKWCEDYHKLHGMLKISAEPPYNIKGEEEKHIAHVTVNLDEELEKQLQAKGEEIKKLVEALKLIRATYWEFIKHTYDHSVTTDVIEKTDAVLQPYMKSK